MSATVYRVRYDGQRMSLPIRWYFGDMEVGWHHDRAFAAQYTREQALRVKRALRHLEDVSAQVDDRPAGRIVVTRSER